MVIGEVASVIDCLNVSVIGSSSSLNSSASCLPTTSTVGVISNNNKHINALQQSFSPDYKGPIIVLVENDGNINLGNWHPIQASKLFANNFSGIIKIQPTGPKKTNITFDSIINGNTNSNILCEYNYKAIIQSTLIFLYGIIKLDNSASEAEFFEGLL